MAIDFSKINNALSSFAGAGERSRREQSQLAQVLQLAAIQQNQMQLKQQNQQQVQEYIDKIKQQAKSIAIRNEDADFIQKAYNEQVEIFKSELQKSGNDPVRFMNSNGRKVLQDFATNVLHGEDAMRIQKNAKNVQQFLELSEGQGGKNAKLIPLSVRQNYVDFMEGRTNNFVNKQLVELDTNLDKNDYTNAKSRAQAILNKGENIINAAINFKIEYDLPDNYEPNEVELEQYLDKYYPTTGVGQSAAINQKLTINMPPAAEIKQQFIALGDVSTKDINNVDYKNKVLDYDLADVNFNVGPQNTDIKGHRAFQGRELDFAQVFVDPNVGDLNTLIENYQVNNSNGQWYNEDGDELVGGKELPDLNINGVFLGYKFTQTDADGTTSTKLVRKEDIDEEPKNAQHVLLQEFEDDRAFASYYYYKEIKMKGNNNGVAAIAEKLKLDSTYQKLQQYEQKNSNLPKEEINKLEKFKNITINSSEGAILKNLKYNAGMLSNTMKKLNFENNNQAANFRIRSTLLALANLENNDSQKTINEFYQMFNANPNLHQALLKDTETFLNTYKEILINKGNPEENVNKYLNNLLSLARKIKNTYTKIDG
jgi:hypothetical protein